MRLQHMQVNPFNQRRFATAKVPCRDAYLTVVSLFNVRKLLVEVSLGFKGTRALLRSNWLPDCKPDTGATSVSVASSSASAVAMASE
jgi:hypothetical protein